MHDPVSRLIFELSKLPGVGEKTATRLAYFILKQDPSYAQSLSEALIDAKQKMGLCKTCFTFSDVNPCRICANPQRDGSIICVLERPSDVLPMEQAANSQGGFTGLYHVLHGALSPLDGIGPEELKIRELLARINRANPQIKEIILATNPSVEGEATALYLGRLLQPLGVRVTQLAHGIPMGGTLEFTDRQTLGKAMSHRREVSPGTQMGTRAP